MTALPVARTLRLHLARPADISPALRYALLLWLVFGVVASVRIVLRPAAHSVFPVFAGAGDRWWGDQPLYADYKPLDYFRYPPLAALGFSVFSAAGLRIGGIAWLWLSLGAYGSGVWRFRQEVLPSWWSPRREFAFLFLATFGAIAGIWNGQSNALIMGLLLWGGAALATGHERTSAGWLALAVSLKPTAAPLVLLVCALWPRRLAVRVALLVGLLALVPFATRPPAVVLRHYSDWLEQQSSLANERWPGFRDAWTVWQVVEHSVAGTSRSIDLKAPLQSDVYRAFQLATAAGCLAWCLVQKRSSASRRELLLRTLSMGSSWLMVFGPAVEYPAYVFLAPFLAAGAVDPDRSAFSKTLARIACGLILVFGWGALTLPLMPVFPAVLLALPIGTTLFATGLAAGTTRRLPTPFFSRRPAVLTGTIATTAAA